MDARHFDALTKTLCGAGTRRGLLGSLATLPIISGWLTGIPTAEGKKKHKKKKHKKKKHKCKPQSLAQTCAGKCGSVQNNCKQTVNCYSCACAVCASGCQFSSVQAAIKAASAGSTIRICAGRYGEYNIAIDRNVTLIGVGEGSDPASNTILDAAGSGQVMLIQSGVAATLRGLRITGGASATFDGAGVANTGALTMTNCTVTGNHCTGNNEGGGISNSNDASLTMTDCTVSGNSSGNGGGAILTLSGPLTMTGCTVSGNSATNGGGALVFNNGGTTLLTSCTIGPTNTAGFGGGLFVANGSDVTLDGTSVTGNTASDPIEKGGGIYNLSGSVTLQNGSDVSGNSPDNCQGTIAGSGCA